MLETVVVPSLDSLPAPAHFGMNAGFGLIGAVKRALEIHLNRLRSQKIMPGDGAEIGFAE